MKKILFLSLLSFFVSIRSINKEIEKAILNSESHKLFNLFSGIVAVSFDDKEYYVKLAHEESTKALMGFDNFRLKRISRFTVGLITFLIGTTALFGSKIIGEISDFNETNINLLMGAGGVTSFLGATEIYKAVIGSDLKKKCKKALAVEALVNRLQVSPSNS